MAKMKVQFDDGAIVEVENSIKIIYELDDPPEGVTDRQLHIKYTIEGRVTDLVDTVSDGDTVSTSCAYLDYIVARLERDP